MSPAKKQPVGESTTCSWCSASVPAEAARCPSCGAGLRDVVDDDVPGVTAVDLQATTRLARLKPPGRVAMWLGAERTTDNPDLTGRIEPPSEEVRQEMLRIELAAIDAEIEAKKSLAEAQRSLAPVDASSGGSTDAALSDAGPSDAGAGDAGATAAGDPEKDSPA